MDVQFKPPELPRQLSAMAVLEYSVLLLLLTVTGEPLVQLSGAKCNAIGC